MKSVSRISAHQTTSSWFDHAFAPVMLLAAFASSWREPFTFLIAKRIVATDMLGEIVSVRGRHSYIIQPESISPAAAWRLDPQHGGGPLMDVAVYPIFTLRDLAGLSIGQLSATGTVRRLYGKTEYDSILFTFLSE